MAELLTNIPRVVIAGLSGGSGKTMVSIGIVHALALRGMRVAPFKKGPDYIDTAWLGLAANVDASANISAFEALEDNAREVMPISGRNLDPFMAPISLLPCLLRYPFTRDPSLKIAVIEGNRGLFDGKDIEGSFSTAELARSLKAPVILVVDCTKMTRTAAALILGCKNFDPELNIAGVILNRITRERHRALVKESVEKLAGVPVLGMIPRLERAPVEERNTGLVLEEMASGIKSPETEKSLKILSGLIEKYVDLEAVLERAREAPNLPETCTEEEITHISTSFSLPKTDNQSISGKPRIGYVRDNAFCQCYIENLEALQNAGAELVSVSILNSELINGNEFGLDGLYFSGGFNLEYAQELSDNKKQRENILRLASLGLPIYAEASGILYLSQEIRIGSGVDINTYKMVGLFDFFSVFQKQPQGLGYVEAVTMIDNPWHPVGSVIHGHEFNYAVNIPGDPAALKNYGRPVSILELSKGYGYGLGEDFYSGIAGKDDQVKNRDGLLKYNTFGLVTQIFAPGCPHWARNFVDFANKITFSKITIR